MVRYAIHHGRKLVEADKIYLGGKRRNMSLAKWQELTGTETVGKTTVADMKDRATKQCAVTILAITHAHSLQGFVQDHVLPGATLYTDGAHFYTSRPKYCHESVNHSAYEYVRDMAHTNGIESF